MAASALEVIPTQGLVLRLIYFIVVRLALLSFPLSYHRRLLHALSTRGYLDFANTDLVTAFVNQYTQECHIVEFSASAVLL